MSAADWATVIAGGLGLMGAAVAIIKIVFKRGGDERESAAATRENTVAVKELAASMRDFKDYTVASLHDLAISHEKLAGKVAVIEEQVKRVP